MSLGNEQWIRNLNELWLDPNRNYHKFERKQIGRLHPRPRAGPFPMENAGEGRYATGRQIE
jgi:hypothetical protein